MVLGVTAALIVYAELRFGMASGLRVAVLAALLIGLDCLQRSVGSRLRYASAIRSVLMILQLLLVFGAAFLPAPLGFGSDVPAPMMLQMPLFTVAACLLVYAVSPSQPFRVILVGAVLAALWWLILPIARHDPATIARANLDLSKLKTPMDFFKAINTPHYFNRGAWLSGIDAILILTSVLAMQAFRLRALARRSARQETARNVLASYFSPQLAEVLLNSSAGMLEPSFRRVAALDCDIRGFTALVEQARPEHAADALRLFRSVIERAVFAQGGAIVAFVGDGALAVFGLGGESGAAAQCAVMAAIEIERGWSAAAARAFGDRSVPVVVGVDIGDALVGLVGKDRAMSLVFLGVPVDGAARLQALTREVAQPILISAAVAQSIFAARGIDVVRVDSVDAYAVSSSP